MTSRREELATNLASIREEIAQYDPTLIVVTKTYPSSDVEILKELGISEFGENRSDEGESKSSQVSGHWNYQGAIQSKKIREILSWADCIHSLDDLAHAVKIERALAESNSTIELFLQLSLDGNPSRGGVEEKALFELAQAIAPLPHLKVKGIMCVPPVEQEPHRAFSEVAAIHQRFKVEHPDSPFLSAGMSGDYMVALEHGATHIRVGSKILGARAYD